MFLQGPSYSVYTRALVCYVLRRKISEMQLFLNSEPQSLQTILVSDFYALHHNTTASLETILASDFYALLHNTTATKKKENKYPKLSPTKNKLGNSSST